MSLGLSQSIANNFSTIKLKPTELNLLIALVFKITGIRMHEGKSELLKNRLRPLLKKHNLASYKEYYDFVNNQQTNKVILSEFVDAVTTNETYFYRTPKLWQFFADEFLPEFHQKNNLKELKVWCAASSSGEEPYTLGILMSEFAAKNSTFRWSLKASDISKGILAKCAQASYQGRAIAQLSKAWLQKYFDKKDEVYTVKTDLKKKIRFFQHNLRDKPPYQGFDIIFLRNVMIYFDVPTKDKILDWMYKVLNPNGILVLGESEAITTQKKGFQYLKPSIYRKIENEKK